MKQLPTLKVAELKESARERLAALEQESILLQKIIEMSELVEQSKFGHLLPKRLGRPPGRRPAPPVITRPKAGAGRLTGMATAIRETIKSQPGLSSTEIVKALHPAFKTDTTRVAAYLCGLLKKKDVMRKTDAGVFRYYPISSRRG